MLSTLYGQNERQQFLKWMLIHNGTTGDFEAIQVMLDSGSRSQGSNFVTPGIVREYRMEREKIPQIRFKLVNGDYFVCNERVKVWWRGKDDKDREISCLVLPERSPVEMPLLGHEFIVKHGGDLLDEEPGLIAYTVQSKKTVSCLTITKWGFGNRLTAVGTEAGAHRDCRDAEHSQGRREGAGAEARGTRSPTR